MSKKIRLTSDVEEKYFDYATSAREATQDFAEGKISSVEWLKTLYDKEAKKFAKQLLLDSGGVKKTQARLRRMYDRIYDGNEWRSDQ